MRSPSSQRKAGLQLAVTILAGCGATAAKPTSTWQQTGSALPTTPGTTTTTTTTPSTTTDTPAFDPATMTCGAGVVLVDPGITPRASLLARFKPGTTRVTIDLETTVGESGGARVQLGIPMTIVVRHRGSSGYPVTMTYGAATGTSSALSAAQLPAFRKQLHALRGIAFHGIVRSDGSWLGLKATVPKGAAPATKALVSQMSDSFESGLAQRVPAEPVGAGARWTVTRCVNVSGVLAKVATDYTLVWRGGSVVVTSGAGTVSGGFLEQGADGNTATYTISGQVTSETRFSPSTIVPARSAITMVESVTTKASDGTVTGGTLTSRVRVTRTR